MSGALEAGGHATGILADSLERAALNRHHRNYLRDGHLLLISPYDPQAGFNVGNAMQRNKVIYALADAALVVQSDYGKGGTWAGATEQLEKFRLGPIYTLPTTQPDAAAESLRKKGAHPWPNPTTAEEFREMLEAGITRGSSIDAQQLPLSAGNGAQSDNVEPEQKLPNTFVEANGPDSPPDERLFATVRSLFGQLDEPKTDKEIADHLKVTTGQVKEWIKRLIEEGALEKLAKPTRYRPTKSSRLF
jgi:predicted Rossmann fold nucleotide-binding protein DprA/Smf involved in DNA uptake